MSDPTRFNHLATGDIRDGDFARVPQTVRFTLGATSSAANPDNKHVIRGLFAIQSIARTIVTALNASAKTISVGTDATAARFASIAVSAGAENDYAVVTPASADVPAWAVTGSAAAVTTVKSFITDVSGVAGTGYVDMTYTVVG